MAAAQDEVRLPDFGSSAETLATPDEERRAGEGMLRELRGLNYVLDDPQIVEYVEALGYRLVAQTDNPEDHFEFFVVRSPEINAFAAPGGYVAVHTGLIVMAESESELAAVLAHEVAHITQKHILRYFESLKNASIPIALAMLGAIIAAQGAGSGDAAQAAVVGGTALMQQQSINFTRHNEYESDRIGIHTLAHAGFAPTAMATFFARMARALRANGEGPPEFLRTHPVTTTRITEAKDRAETIAKDSSSRLPPLDESPRFLLFRERARVLGSDAPNELVSYYRKEEALPPHVRRYGLGLALARTSKPAEGAKLLAELAREHPDEVAYSLALAEAQSVSGQRKLALERLETLARERPDHRAIVIEYAEELIASGRRDYAAKAVAALRPLLASNAGNPRLQLSFARATELAGDEVRAGEAHAEVALLNGRAEDALSQLNALLKRQDIDYYQRARIEARIAQITPWALEQRRHALPEDV